DAIVARIVAAVRESHLVERLVRLPDHTGCLVGVGVIVARTVDAAAAQDNIRGQVVVVQAGGGDAVRVGSRARQLPPAIGRAAGCQVGAVWCLRRGRHLIGPVALAVVVDGCYLVVVRGAVDRRVVSVGSRRACRTGQQGFAVVTGTPVDVVRRGSRR